MPGWKDGDRVRVVERAVTDEDRKKNQYFEHMAGLVGTIQNVYPDGSVAVQIDPTCLSDVSSNVHQTATVRMREKFANIISEEQRKQLTKEELEFNAHYMILVQPSDLTKA